nr:MAG TPA: hypothetical protein [Caudoviricetes sp.]
MESCLRKCSCRNCLVILLDIEFSSLFLGAGTTYIQAALGFVDAPADTLQCRAASRAADIEGVSGTAAFGVEPEVVRYHLFDPHSALRLDCAAVGCGDHCHFLRTLSVAVDEWVILDVCHGLHRLSVCIEEPTFAVGQCFCLCSEEHGGETILHLPDIQALVTGHHYGCATLGLEEQAALIVLLGEVLSAEIVDARLQAVKESVFHSVLLLSLILGVWVTGCYAIIGTASFPHGAMWQVIMVVFKICFPIEKTYNHLPHCPMPCDYVSGGASNSEMSR